MSKNPVAAGISFFAVAGAVLSTLVACSTTGSSVVNPGCLGASGESCGPYPDGTFCPGTPIVCTQCGPSVYELAPSGCTCVSGAWDCAPPASGTGTCPNPFGAGFFSDPACSAPLVDDAGEDGSLDGPADALLDDAADALLDDERGP